MTLKKETVAKSHIFSERLIKKYTKVLQEGITEHMRLQSEGKLPYYSRLPATVVRTGDIMNILKIKERQAQRIMAALRAELGRTKKQYISVDEFSTHTGLPQSEVQRAMNLRT